MKKLSLKDLKKISNEISLNRGLTAIKGGGVTRPVDCEQA